MVRKIRLLKPTFSISLMQHHCQALAAAKQIAQLEAPLRDDPNFVMQIQDEIIMAGDKK